MSSRRIEVFFYGLFMDADLLRTKGAHPINIRSACVRGFALCIGQRATLVRTLRARAYGIVMELTHAEIERLYSEASVRSYRTEAVIAELADGSHVPALCFSLLVSPDPEKANSEYAARLRDLARRLGLPSDYVASIKWTLSKTYGRKPMDGLRKKEDPSMNPDGVWGDFTSEEPRDRRRN